MKVCANLPCSASFEPATSRSRYCCKACGHASARRRWRSTHPEAAAANVAGLNAWTAANPEKVKLNIDRARRKAYREGKRLPPWMFS